MHNNNIYILHTLFLFMADDNKEIPQLNVTAKWLDNLYEKITKITNIERICRTGMPSEEKGLENYEGEQQSEYKARMLNLLIDEIEMLLPDIKRKLKNDDYKQISLKMIIIKANSRDPFLDSIQDHVSHTDPEYYITQNFVLVLRNLCSIRADIVGALSPLLYGETETANDRRSIR